MVDLITVAEIVASIFVAIMILAVAVLTILTMREEFQRSNVEPEDEEDVSDVSE